MTYKIVSDLKWLPARGLVRENNFSTVVAPTQGDDLNPNGLFSGFCCENTFYTSKWTGTKFVEHSFPISEVTKFCTLETESSEETSIPKEDPMPRKDKPIKNPFGDSFPFGDKNNPFNNKPVGDNPYTKRGPFTFPDKMILSGKDIDMKSFKIDDFLKDPEKILESSGNLISELSKLFETESNKESKK